VDLNYPVPVHVALATAAERASWQYTYGTHGRVINNFLPIHQSQPFNYFIACILHTRKSGELWKRRLHATRDFWTSGCTIQITLCGGGRFVEGRFALRVSEYSDLYIMIEKTDSLNEKDKRKTVVWESYNQLLFWTRPVSVSNVIAAEYYECVCKRAEYTHSSEGVHLFTSCAHLNV